MIAGLLRRLRLRPARPRTDRNLGDAARDARRWEEAAAAYRRHLAARPQDAPIWVQLGHAEKEAGNLPAAEAAYRRAGELRPDDHDPPLHLGHVLKMQGRMADAIAAYELSERLAPANHAAVELAVLRPPPPGGAAPRRRASAPPATLAESPLVAAARAAAAAAPEEPGAQRALAEALLAEADPAAGFEAARAAAARAFALAPERRHWQLLRRAAGHAPGAAGAEPGGPHLFDVTDLLAMLRQAGRATGIQRVQLGLAEGILADPATAAAARFVFTAERLGPLWTLDAADMRALITYCLAEPHDLGRARFLVARAMDAARPTHLPSARVLVILGAFWFWAGAPAALARLRAQGIRIGVLVYDLIPVTHPEYTSEGTVRAFRQGLEEGARLWDFALTISAFTARTLEAELARLGAPPIPIRPVPLAHRMNAPVAAGEAWPEAIADLRGRDFVLCVGTLEARKNHLALFQAWRLLRDAGFEPPPLVLVGRPGWRIEDLMAQLEATRFLDGRIRIVHGVSDPELAALYRACLFTVFPSFTEGWGLPVGESLAEGKPVLAALEGATPEAAAGFAIPLDALSPRQIAGEVRRLCEDRAALAAAEARIRQGFVPRGWAEVTADFLAGLAALTAQPAPQRAPPQPPRLAPGARLDFPAAAADWGALLPLGPGFDAPAPEGVPILGGAASLTLTVAEPLTLLLRLAARPWAEENRLGVALGDGPLRWHGVTPGEALVVALALPAGESVVGLVLDGPLDPPPEIEDRRPIRLALAQIAAAPAEPAAVPPHAPLRFAAAGFGPAAAAALAEGWDLSAGPEGVAPLAAAPVLRFRPEGAAGRPLRAVLHLALAPGAAGVLRHPGGETPLPRGAEAMLLPLALAAGEDGLAAIPLAMAEGGVPPIRLVALRWAAEDDIAGRLALLETVLLPGKAAEGPPAERLARLEGALIPAAAGPLPGGEAGRAARLLLQRRGG
ncbi:MAG: glycosyltransferase [Rubritepida sp.]|nr:glycosyltransferase [Rubritepida sp.]